VAGVTGAIVGALVITWVVALGNDVMTLKIEMAQLKLFTATAVDVAKLQGRLDVMSEKLQAANASLARIESDERGRGQD
jgi:hypothetical protein